MWQPDRQSKKPIYQQIAEHLQQRIRQGEYPPGSLLPSERKLAGLLQVNRSTIIQAYEDLRAHGWVYRTVGSGTRVSNPESDEAKAPNWRRYLENGTMRPNLAAMRRIREELRGEKAPIDMASGELSDDLFPNEHIQRLLGERPYGGHLGYDDPQGYGPLRETIARFLCQYLGIDAAGSSLLVTSGSQQSLFLITQCLLSPGDAVAVEDPSYCHSLSMFRSAGLRVFSLPVDGEGIDPDDIAALHRQHRLRMVFLNPNFQNPTGTVLSGERRARLLDVTAGLGIPIVEDDPFSLTAFDGRPPQPLRAMAHANGQMLYVGSLSKIAASGLRIGWLLGPHSVIARLADARQQMDFGMSVIPQWVASEFLGSSMFDRHISSLRQRLAYKMDTLRAALDTAIPGLASFAVPNGGLNLWVNWRGAGDPDETRMLERAIRAGMTYVPGQVFGTRPGFLRLSFAKPALDQIEEGVLRLRRAWTETP
ncbi:aminotransferase-like domain-containing protein [Cohnella nanjingensis]|uniref:PLP-dependent aminotransferase family protein n=1 Tax=Cohnella nanjingensis TaxID=1387779 RepID=A0A7X0RSR6_9BACL|nr:PLP-dependent aminotransferase family protein [Cohnella nanjingensis]MBB6672890.1 PLP-dependent aminotransferase family protein [Cohnella nanjingensis]